MRKTIIVTLGLVFGLSAAQAQIQTNAGIQYLQAYAVYIYLVRKMIL